MDKSSKIFFVIFSVLIMAMIVVSFFKYIILRDYHIQAETICDPNMESCFVYQCDPSIDSECPDDPAKQVSYYKLIEKKASTIPVCNQEDAACSPLICESGEDCREILCDDSNVPEGESCSDQLVNSNEQMNVVEVK